MAEIISEFAAAKINLALHVLGRRADGYHELDSIVAFADVGDTVEMRVADATSLTVNGPFAYEVPATADNLVLRAHALLSEHVALPPVAITLTKRLPVASGIGGGSADAAATLRGLLRLSGQVIDPKVLNAVALRLGADVPVCLYGKACRMQGVGEKISAINHPPAPAILLVNPRLPCSTADVFKTMGLGRGSNWRTALDPSAPEAWRNDMTDAAVKVLPVIGEVLQTLAAHHPSATVRMSGSGATCFALCESRDEAEAAAANLSVAQPSWWVSAAALS